MAPVILIEGADNCGKTVLAEWLEEKHGFEYLHEGPPPAGRDQLHYYGLCLWRALQAKKSVVFDRCHLGELVYGPVMRDKDLLGYYGLKLFLRVLKSQPVLCVICAPPYDVVYKGWEARRATEYLKTEAQLRDVYHRYQGLAAYRPHKVFDFTKHTAEEFYENYFDQGKLINGPLDLMPAGVIGDPNAKYLVIGEQANQAEIDWPWFAADGSSRYLNERLWEAGFEEEEMCFVNAQTIQGNANDLGEVVKKLPHLQRVVALGKLSQKEVDEQLGGLLGTKLVVGKHPAYFKRFHSKKRQEYVDWLRSVREGK
jgi:thymidylate kinase